MTTVTKIATGVCHTAYLDAMSGAGVLVCPPRSEDLRVSGGATFQEADWDASMRALWALGWQPTEDDEGEWHHLGDTPAGHRLINLCNPDPISSDWDWDQQGEAVTACVAEAQAQH